MRISGHLSRERCPSTGCATRPTLLFASTCGGCGEIKQVPVCEPHYVELAGYVRAAGARCQTCGSHQVKISEPIRL